jgi:aminomethyltransferase
VRSCGLGARDTLRLEAGMNLYGNDMERVDPPARVGSRVDGRVRAGRPDFIGRAALEAIRQRGGSAKLVGLLLEDRGVLRGHQKVIVPDVGEGEITSGTFSPTLEKSIALARVPRATGDRVQVDIRGKLLAARVVKPPFVRHGKSGDSPRPTFPDNTKSVPHEPDSRRPQVREKPRVGPHRE